MSCISAMMGVTPSLFVVSMSSLAVSTAAS